MYYICTRKETEEEYSAINMQNVKKAYTNVTPEPEEDIIIKHNQFDNASEIEEKLDNSLKTNNNKEIAEQINSIEEQKIEQPKRGRGRPKKKVEEIEEEPKKEIYSNELYDEVIKVVKGQEVAGE